MFPGADEDPVGKDAVVVTDDEAADDALAILSSRNSFQTSSVKS